MKKIKFPSRQAVPKEIDLGNGIVIRKAVGLASKGKDATPDDLKRLVDAIGAGVFVDEQTESDDGGSKDTIRSN